MNHTDALLLEFLSSRAGFAAHQLDHIRAWWKATAFTDEGLPRFLVRQGLISESTATILRQIGEGHLSSVMGFALLSRSEFESIRIRLPQVVDSAREAAIDATISLLASHATVKNSESERAEESPRVGSMLGKYLLTEWVGRGAVGTVFRALHPTLHIPVAVKVLNPESSDDANSRQRLKAEARLLAQLNHPHVVRVFDFEADGKHPFLVLEHINGHNLAELIEQYGRLQPGPCLRLLRQLAEALAAAEQLGIIHRDIKPANILLTRSGDAKLADLGLAAVRATASFSILGPQSTYDRVGTAHYIAPEVAGANQPADSKSDIYSLGATLFHALTGEPPFVGENAWEIIEQHARAERPDPRESIPALSDEFAELVMRMLARDPNDRPATFAELLSLPVLNRPIRGFDGQTRVAGSRSSRLWPRAHQQVEAG